VKEKKRSGAVKSAKRKRKRAEDLGVKSEEDRGQGAGWVPFWGLKI